MGIKMLLNPEMEQWVMAETTDEEIFKAVMQSTNVEENSTAEVCLTYLISRTYINNICTSSYHWYR